MISVLFATYNGADTLERTLASISVATGARADIQLVVVNNGSTDRTGEILRSYSDHLNMEIVEEPVRGKNRALNAGLMHCKGSIIAFTDDDVIVAPNWLNELALLTKRFALYDIFGGPIEPLFENDANEMVRSLSQEMRATLYAERMPIGPHEVPPPFLYGPNFSIRRKIIDAGLRFDLKVGPDGTNNYRMGAETTFLQLCWAHGHRACFFNRLRVQHIVPAEHTTLKWIYGRARRSGYGRAYAEFTEHRMDGKPHFCNLPRERLREVYRAFLDYVRTALSHDRQASILRRWKIIEHLSYCGEYRRLRKNGEPKD